MSYYQRHVFFCCNQREAPEACCANHGAVELQAYAKDADQGARPERQGQGADEQGRLPRPLRGRARCSSSIPEAVWYTYVDRADIDEIIDRHVVGGEIVERLRI